MTKIDDYHAIQAITKDPYADLDRSRQHNLNSQISLGIYHPQSQIRSALKGAMRSSKDS